MDEDVHLLCVGGRGYGFHCRMGDVWKVSVAMRVMSVDGSLMVKMGVEGMEGRREGARGGRRLNDSRSSCSLFLRSFADFEDARHCS